MTMNAGLLNVTEITLISIKAFWSVIVKTEATNVSKSQLKARGPELCFEVKKGLHVLFHQILYSFEADSTAVAEDAVAEARA